MTIILFSQICWNSIYYNKFYFYKFIQCTRNGVRFGSILSSADLVTGRSRTIIFADILHFRTVVNRQNDYHPRINNEFVVATILNPPKLDWFEDNTGPPPLNHVMLLSELEELNSWIAYFNQNCF